MAKILARQVTLTLPIYVFNYKVRFKLICQLMIKTALMIILLTTLSRASVPTVLQANTNTDLTYLSANINGSNVYGIKVARTNSSDASQPNKCVPSQKQIHIVAEEELYRLATANSQDRKQTLLQKLTTLDDQENIIEDFDMIGEDIFLISTDGYGVFVSPNGSQKDKPQRMKISSQALEKAPFTYIVKKYDNDSAVVFTQEYMALCQRGKDSCHQVTGYQKVLVLNDVELYEQKGQKFVFIITDNETQIYEMADEKVSGRKVISKETFETESTEAKLSVHSVVLVKQSYMLLLDTQSGIWRLNYDGKPNKFSGKAKHIYDQVGCNKMVSVDQAKRVFLSCTITGKEFFIQELQLEQQFTTSVYEAKQTVVLRDFVYDLDIIDGSVILTRIFSGVKMFWASQTSQPFPFPYRSAGSIFLHNAYQAKIKSLNGTITLFLTAGEELRRFDLKSRIPEISCYSQTQIQEQYQVIYTYACSKSPSSSELRNICSFEETLHFNVQKHKEIRILATLVPFILSIIALIVLGYIAYKAHRKFGKDVESARLKYNTSNEFDMEN